MDNETCEPAASANPYVPFITPRERRIAELEPVVAKYGVTMADVLSRNQTKIVVRARREVAKILKGKEWSYTEIGRFLGRDHTTIIYLVRTENALPRSRTTNS